MLVVLYITIVASFLTPTPAWGYKNDDVKEEISKVIEGLKYIIKQLDQPDFEFKNMVLEYKLVLILLQQSFDRVFKSKKAEPAELKAAIDKLNIKQDKVQHLINSYITFEVDVSINACLELLNTEVKAEKKEDIMISKASWEGVKEMLLQSYIAAYQVKATDVISMDRHRYGVPPADTLTVLTK